MRTKTKVNLSLNDDQQKGDRSSSSPFCDSLLRGFSLIELVVTLCLLGSLAALVPHFFSSVYKKNKLSTIANNITSIIQFAKVEALFKAQTTLISTLPGRSSWNEGMALCLDNETHQCSEANLIRIWHWHYQDLNLSWVGFESNHYLRFTPDLMGRTANGTFVVSDSAGNVIHVVVNRLGKCTVSPPGLL